MRSGARSARTGNRRPSASGRLAPMSTTPPIRRSGAYRMINARAETVTEKRAFAQLIGKPSHRALLIADDYIEWKRGESRKAPRQPFIHRVDGGEPFAFPALWTRSEVGGEWIESVTLITTDANAVARQVDDRMPVILPGPAEGGALAHRRAGRRARAPETDRARPPDGGAGEPRAQQGRRRPRRAGAARRSGANVVPSADNAGPLSLEDPVLPGAQPRPGGRGSAGSFGMLEIPSGGRLFTP
jgi:hypothetical protein